MDTSQIRHIQKQKILQVACFVLATLACLPAPLVIANFGETIYQFSSDLPWLTMAYFSYYPGFYVLAGVFSLLMLIGIAQKSEQKIGLYTNIAVLSLLFSFVLIVVSIVALQLPIYKVGNAV